MIQKKESRIPSIAVLVLSLLMAGPVPFAAEPAEESAEGASKLKGTIFEADGKTPAQGVQILAYHLSTEQLYTSEPTGSKGRYEMNDLPFGYFDVAVQTADGLFVGNSVVNIAPSGRAVLTVTLQPIDDDDPEQAARTFPGSEDPASGMASVQEKMSGKAFISSKKGIAILAGSGAVLLLLIAGSSSSSSSDDPSPTTPSFPGALPSRSSAPLDRRGRRSENDRSSSGVRGALAARSVCPREAPSTTMDGERTTLQRRPGSFRTNVDTREDSR